MGCSLPPAQKKQHPPSSRAVSKGPCSGWGELLLCYIWVCIFTQLHSDFQICATTGDSTFGATVSGYSSDEMLLPGESEQTEPDIRLPEECLGFVPGRFAGPWQNDYVPLEDEESFPFSEDLTPAQWEPPDLHWQATSRTRDQAHLNTTYCTETSYEPGHSQGIPEARRQEESIFWDPHKRNWMVNTQSHHRSAAARRVQSRRSFHRPKPVPRPKLQKLASLPASFHFPPYPWEQEETQL